MAEPQSTDRPYWYECNDMIVCQYCRAEMLRDWAPGTTKGGVAISKDETVRRSDFSPLGRTPWAGNDEGERYMQCDGCNTQWGPDS
jgi:hypothetical protein